MTGGRTGEIVDHDRISRRSFFFAGGAAALAAGGVVMAVDRPGTSPGGPRLATADSPTPIDRTATAPATVSGVLALADGTVGRRLLGSPWHGWAGLPTAAWSATYVTWLLRGTGVPATQDVTALHDGFLQGARIGDSPRPGALVFYHRGDARRPFHVGLVTSVTAGVPQTVEGDHPWTLPLTERFVRRHSRPWDARTDYAYPQYR